MRGRSSSRNASPRPWFCRGSRSEAKKLECIKSAFQNPVGDRRVASKDGQISASITQFRAYSDPHRHLECRF